MIADTFKPLVSGVLTDPVPVVKVTNVAPLEDGIRREIILRVAAFFVHQIIHAHQAPVVRGEAGGEAAAMRSPI